MTNTGPGGASRRSMEPEKTQLTQGHAMLPRWECLPFDALGGSAVYALLRLRAQVFVVEQACAYEDPDGLDTKALHLMAWRNDELVAYARCLPPGAVFRDSAIGRIVVAPGGAAATSAATSCAAPSPSIGNAGRGTTSASMRSRRSRTTTRRWGLWPRRALSRGRTYTCARRGLGGFVDLHGTARGGCRMRLSGSLAGK
jgi:hypothetical protein